MRDDTSTATTVAAAPRRVLHSDPHDFAGLYIRHRASLTRHARRHLNDVRDADEVVQEAFLRLFLALPELETELQALAYCRRTITNLCIDRYRADARRPNLVDLESVPQERFADDDHGDPVVRAEDAALVREAMSMLPALHRSALVKREIEEKSLPVIADELAIPEDNVKHLLFRARRTLRKLLAGTSLAPGVDVERGRALPGAPRAKSSGIAALLVLLVLGIGSGPDLEAVPVVGVDLPDVIGVTRLTDAVADVVADVVDRVSGNEPDEAEAAVRPGAAPGRSGAPAATATTPAGAAAPGATASSPGGSASGVAVTPQGGPAAVMPPAGAAPAEDGLAGGTVPLPPGRAAGPVSKAVESVPSTVSRPGPGEARGDADKQVVAPADQARGRSADVVSERKPAVDRPETPQRQVTDTRPQDKPAGQGRAVREAKPAEGPKAGPARGAEARATGQAQAAANAQAKAAKAAAQAQAKAAADAQARAAANAQARAAKAAAQAQAKAAAQAQARAAANAQAAAQARAAAKAEAKQARGNARVAEQRPQSPGRQQKGAVAPAVQPAAPTLP